MVLAPLAFTLMLTFNMVCSLCVLTAMHCVFYSHLVRDHVSESFDHSLSRFFNY
jgi:hypothetical protein